MKFTSTILLCAAFVLSSSFAVNAQGNNANKGNNKQAIPVGLLTKYDKSGDGVLSSDERTALRRALNQEYQALIKEFDKSGSGDLDADEFKAMKQSHRKMMVEKFDEDGNGKLEGKEQRKARAWTRDNMPERAFIMAMNFERFKNGPKVPQG
ncbi:EF-hand domain-containing protein [Persicirhabdus sediminis]|uniref:EF-hand domain-containing protein n=1 Tax=Persicirhabdus sediminis TaxID=454144 RepID=A0A8J7SJN0_9BACT|nr:EF-hand domain-containing protein [Persicirhabdus sediminis]MBK1791216.1 hypothetical protein [Persicirhabdus sediminis]